MANKALFLKLIILIGLFGAFAWIGQFNHISDYDEALHLDVARSIYRDGVPIRSLAKGVAYLYHPPLFLYLIAPLTGPLHDGTLIGRLVSAAFGLLTVALVFRLCDDLKANRIGLIAGLFVAVSPLFQIYAFNIQAEVMLTALIMTGLLAFLRACRHERIAYAWLAGILFALAAWIKFLTVLPVAACGLFGLIWIRRRPAWGHLLALGLPLVIALVLWVAFGLWLDRVEFMNVMRDWFGGPKWPWDARLHFSLAGWLEVVVRDVLSYPGTILLVCTLPWRLRLYRRGMSLIVLEVYAALTLVYTVFVSVKEVRHLIPLIPVAGILMGVGVVQFLQAVRWSIWSTWKRVVLIGLAVLFLVEASPLTLFPRTRPTSVRDWLDTPYATRVLVNDPYLANVREAGQYLGRVTETDTVVTVVHECTVAGYYADRHYLMLFVLSYERIINVLSQTDWLLVDKDLYPNLNSDQVEQVKAYIAEHFNPVAKFDQPGGPPAVVYQRKATP